METSTIATIGAAATGLGQVGVTAAEATATAAMAQPLSSQPLAGLLLLLLLVVLAAGVLWSRRQQACLDTLTGLPNRSDGLRSLQGALDGARATSLVLLGLDGFKRINDCMGYATGDALLAAVGDRIRARLTKGEVLARFEGDTFILLLPDTAEPSARRCQELLKCLDAPFEFDRQRVFLTASAGLSTFPYDADVPWELVRLAGAALRVAKQRNRGHVCRYIRLMGGAASTDIEMEDEIRLALEQDRVEVHIEPRLGLADGMCHSAEALVRIRRTDGTLLFPGAFIAVAERCGLMPRLGAAVLTQACRTLATLRCTDATSAFRLSVNVSPLELQDDGLVQRVADALAQHGLPASALELELTESALLQDLELAQRCLRELHALGVSIALDDFGTGYSGLSHLLLFPVSVLKIDRSFIAKLFSDRTADALVDGVIGMAQRLGLRVVAEGIENTSFLAPLRALGCDEAQGYAIARAMPPEAVQAWLEQTHANVSLVVAA